MAIIKVGDKAKSPSIRPSLLLDFANSKTLDTRINFTRSSAGTYYDGRTKVKAEQNLFKYSQDFTSTDYWDYSRHALTGSQTAPDGTPTAYKFTQYSSNNTSGYFGHLDWNFVPGTYTFSGFFKAGADGGYVTIDERQGGSKRSWFNLQNGTVDSSSPSHTARIINVGRGWYRCSITFTVSTNHTTQLLFYFSNVGTGLSETNITPNGESGFAWGLQYEERDDVTDYVPTTSQPIVKYQPVLKTALAGEPRFDHDPATDESKGLLVEKASTNITLHSQEAQTSPNGWQYNATTYINNYAIAPDGTRTAIFMYPILGTRRHEMSKRTDITPNSVYTLSFYVKKVSDLNYLNVSPTSGGSTALFTVNLDEGSIEYKGSQGYANNAKIQDVGNGWYRVSSVFVSTNTEVAAYMSPGTRDVDTSVFSDTEGTDTKFHGMLIWGFQVELGIHSTSYIKTTSPATRSAELVEMPYSEWSKVYNKEETTAYVEASVATPNNPLQYTVVYYGTGGSPSMHVYNGKFGGGVTGAFGLYPSSSNHIQPDQLFKAGIGYKNSDYITSVDGVHTATSSSGASTVHSDAPLRLGSSGSANHINGHISKFAYYPKRFTNDQIISLTEE